jgi:RNA polymerase sigma-70 factor (ECF subfamily)
MGKRLVRAKSKIRQAGIPFRIPERDELPGRLDTVLDAIYAAFTEGWADPAGTDVVRRDLTEEALFLARLVAGLLPEEPETLGLLALMLHATARHGARRSENGEYVPLAEQDPASWDMVMIREAETLLRRASALGAVGRYQLEGALQSAHVYRRHTGRDNRDDVLRLPDVTADARLAEYQPYWAARAELLARTGEHADARHAYEIAIGLERDPAVRRFLQRRRELIGGTW